jgi:hypothetical protein
VDREHPNLAERVEAEERHIEGGQCRLPVSRSCCWSFMLLVVLAVGRSCCWSFLLLVVLAVGHSCRSCRWSFLLSVIPVVLAVVVLPVSRSPSRKFVASVSSLLFC